MAVPYYVAGGSGVGASSGNITVPEPSYTTGDIIVVIAATWNPDDLTCSATGVEDNSETADTFELIYTGNGSDEGLISVWAGRVTGTLGTITVAGATESIVARAFSVRGAPSSGAFLGSEAAVPGYTILYPSTSTTVSFSALTTGANDEMVVLCGGWDDNTNVLSRDTGNLTEDYFYYGTTSQGSDSGYGILFGTLAAAGSIGSPTFTLANAEHYGSCFFTIIPAPASGSKVPAMDNAYRQRRAA